jgi:hypothetical protein
MTVNKYMHRSSEKEKSHHTGVFFFSFFLTNSKLTVSQSISIKVFVFTAQEIGFLNPK